MIVVGEVSPENYVGPRHPYQSRTGHTKLPISVFDYINMGNVI